MPLFLLLAALPVRGSVQEAAARPEDAVVGSWAGSATVTAEAASACRYVGAAEPPAVTLEIVRKADGLGGTLALTLEAPAGSSCAPIRERHELAEISATASTLSFTDTLGRQWSLALREGTLAGIVSGKDGSGEVSLKRPASAASAAVPAAATAPRGSLLGGIGGVVAANVVGLGAFVAVNELAKGTRTTGEGTVCSPRLCFVGDPCDCNTTLVTGGSCGETKAGVAFGGACNLPALPCESSLSCNNGICEDRSGRCRF